MVRAVGIEPTLIAEPVFESSAAISAFSWGRCFRSRSAFIRAFSRAKCAGAIAGIVFFVYNLAVSALGFLSAAAFRAGYDWKVLLWIGIVPLSLALFAPLFIPDDRKLVPMDGIADGQMLANAKLPITELFAPGVVRQTILTLTCIRAACNRHHASSASFRPTYIPPTKSASLRD